MDSGNENMHVSVVQLETLEKDVSPFFSTDKHDTAYFEQCNPKVFKKAFNLLTKTPKKQLNPAEIDQKRCDSRWVQH